MNKKDLHQQGVKKVQLDQGQGSRKHNSCLLPSLIQLQPNDKKYVPFILPLTFILL